MTTVLRILSVILIWGQAKTQLQPESFQTTALGATLQVNCQVFTGSRTLVWYKLDPSSKLQLLASENTSKGRNIYQDDRYSVKSSETSSTFRLTDVTWEDAGTYYCGVMNEYDVHFGPGTVVVVEGKSKPRPVVQSPEYMRVQPGDSVTLSCAFTTSLCTEDHVSVRWKKISSSSEIISWDNGPKICENQVSTGETSCVHNLTMQISSAEDETYLCEVTACGHTLWGTGSKIHLDNNCIKGSDTFIQSPIVIALIGLNIAFGLSVLVLMRVVCSNHRKQNQDVRCGSNQDFQAQETPAEETLFYSQVKFRKE